MNFIDVLGLFEQDAQTQGIVMAGEIGGSDEEAVGVTTVHSPAELGAAIAKRLI